MKNNHTESTSTQKSVVNVLLIGATGKLGSAVLEKLQKGDHPYEIGLLVRKLTDPILKSNCQIFIGDILTDNIISAFDWADIIINCSGFVSYARQDKNKLYSVNVIGVKKILEICVKLNKPLIHTSSAIAYGSSSQPMNFKEEDSPEDVYRGEYAKSKLLADQIIKTSTIPYVIFRPGTLISTLTKLFKFYKKGFVAELKGGASFALREEVAQAYVNAIDYLLVNKNQTVFNLGGNNLTFLDVFERFKEHEYIDTKLVRSNYLSALSLANDYFLAPVLKKSIITRDNFITGSHFTYIDSSKAQKELNYKIPPFNLSLNEVIENVNQ